MLDQIHDQHSFHWVQNFRMKFSGEVFPAHIGVTPNSAILNPVLAVKFAIPLKARDFYCIINFVGFLR